MDFELFLRKLARSSYWQSLYSSSKEINGVFLFSNTYNFSGLQNHFLNWLKVYAMLYSELSQLTDKYLTEAVINNDIRCDAFLYYRRKKIEADWKKLRQEEKIQKLKSLHPKKRKPDANIIDVDLRSPNA